MRPRPLNHRKYNIDDGHPLLRELNLRILDYESVVISLLEPQIYLCLELGISPFELKGEIQCVLFKTSIGRWVFGEISPGGHSPPKAAAWGFKTWATFFSCSRSEFDMIEGLIMGHLEDY